MIIQDAEFSALHSDNNLSSNAKGEFIFPEGFALFRADFIRDGSDLLVRSADGNGLRLSDYFLDPIPADLLSHDGAVLKGHIVLRLAGPPFPAQYAQAGGIDLEDAIGQVELLEGVAFVQRTDGTLMAFGRGNTIDGRMPMSLSSDLVENWTYSASPFPPIKGRSTRT